MGDLKTKVFRKGILPTALMYLDEFIDEDPYIIYSIQNPSKEEGVDAYNDILNPQSSIANSITGKSNGWKRIHPTYENDSNISSHTYNSSKRPYRETQKQPDNVSYINESNKRQYLANYWLMAVKRFYVRNKVQSIAVSDTNNSTKRRYVSDDLPDIEDNTLVKRPYCLTSTITDFSSTVLSFLKNQEDKRDSFKKVILPFYIKKSGIYDKKRKLSRCIFSNRSSEMRRLAINKAAY